MPSEVLKNPLFVVCAFTFGTSNMHSITTRIVFMFAPPKVRQIVQLLACIAGVSRTFQTNFHRHAIPAPPVGHDISCPSSRGRAAGTKSFAKSILLLSARLHPSLPPLSALQSPFGITEARPSRRHQNVARANLCFLGFGSGGRQQHRARAPALPSARKARDGPFCNFVQTRRAE